MKLLALLSAFALCTSVLSKPINLRHTTPEDCNFEGLFGNTKLIRQRCIEDAIFSTKGMYLNLVRTYETPNGPLTFPIDRPNNHGPIYLETTAESQTVEASSN